MEGTDESNELLRHPIENIVKVRLTRLGYFWKILTTILLTKVAQNFGNVLIGGPKLQTLRVCTFVKKSMFTKRKISNKMGTCIRCLDSNSNNCSRVYFTTTRPGPDPIKIFSSYIYSTLVFNRSDWLLKPFQPIRKLKNELYVIFSWNLLYRINPGASILHTCVNSVGLHWASF